VEEEKGCSFATGFSRWCPALEGMEPALARLLDQSLQAFRLKPLIEKPR